MIFRRAFGAALSYLAIAGCASGARVPNISPATSADAAGMTDMQSLVADFAVDMRYASSNNFVGTRIEGYGAPRCLLLQPVAQALQRVELALRRQQLRMQPFDCYRPVRAVAHFVRWAHDLNDQRTKADYYPNLPKQALLGDYIAPTSGHSRGATLDLTVLKCDPTGAVCTPLDMGTPFDFFDVRAHTDAADITAQQRANRQLLRDAMRREGFENYPLEWWHYTFKPEPTPATAYDFPIR